MHNPSTYTIVGQQPTDSLFCEEEQVYIQGQGTDGERRYSGDVPQTYQTRYTTTGELYRACVRAHGRCIGKMYQDINGKTIQIGWVFLKKFPTNKNDPDPGLQETWVAVYRIPPQKVVTWTPPQYPTFKREKAHATTHSQ